MLDVNGRINGPDDDGNLTAKFSPDDLQRVVTNSWSGVRKMFPIGTSRVPVIAVAAGRARLKDRTVTSLGLEFQRSARTGGTVKDTAEEFLEFVRGYYDQHYEGSQVPQRLRDGPVFLVGGFGQRAKFPALYRVNVQENSSTKELANGDSGLSWGGQADAVERIIRGYDARLKREIEEKIEDFPFGKHKRQLNYANLPLQEGVNMVSYFVLMQAGMARFGDGIATVGGRTHIAVVTKEKGVTMLNEPQLTHKYIGFSDER